MRSSTIAWAAACAFMLLSAAGCGFHLRGGTPLSPQLERIYLQGISPYSKLGAGLKRRLEAHGIEVVASAEKAGALLTITHNNLQRQVLSVGSIGKVQEFAISYILQFQVTDAGGEVLLPPQRVELVRRYRFDRRSLLSAGEQAALLRDVLIEKMIERIIWRLEALSPGDED